MQDEIARRRAGWAWLVRVITQSPPWIFIVSEDPDRRKKSRIKGFSVVAMGIDLID